MIDYQVQFMNFPNKKVKETVTPNEDGSYTIFIDGGLSKKEQENAFVHAMRHILENDFEKDIADVIEKYAHRI